MVLIAHIRKIHITINRIGEILQIEARKASLESALSGRSARSGANPTAVPRDSMTTLPRATPELVSSTNRVIPDPRVTPDPRVSPDPSVSTSVSSGCNTAADSADLTTTTTSKF